MNIENNPTSLNNTQAQASLNNIQESVRKRHNKLSTTLMHEYVPCFHVFSFSVWFYLSVGSYYKWFLLPAGKFLDHLLEERSGF